MVFASWPQRARDRLLHAALKPQIAPLAHLGENFTKAPESLCRLARGRARVCAIACVHVLAWRAKERGGDRSPPRTPSLRGHRKRCTARLPPFSAGTTSRPPPPPPPPPHRRRTAALLGAACGSFFCATVEVDFWSAFACFLAACAHVGCVGRVRWISRVVAWVSDACMSVCAFRFSCDCDFARCRMSASGARCRFGEDNNVENVSI